MTLDNHKPRYYLSNAPEDTPLETLARVSGSRWRIEPEFETANSDVGLDEYEVRTWADWRLPAEPAAVLGGKSPRSPGSRACPRVDGGVPGGAGDASLGAVWALGTAVVAGRNTTA